MASTAIAGLILRRRVAATSQNLAAQVRFVDRIEVTDRNVADTAGSEIGGSRTADTAHTNQQHPAVRNALLPVCTDLW
jgi:hypothetical protein